MDGNAQNVVNNWLVLGIEKCSGLVENSFKIVKKPFLMFFEPKTTNIEHDFQIFVVPLQQENWFLMVKVYGWIIFWGKVRCEASLLFLKEIKGTHFKPYFPKSMTERIRYYIWFAQTEHHFKAFFREKSGKTIRYQNLFVFLQQEERLLWTRR